MPKNQRQTAPGESAGGLRARLRAIVEAASQAEVARKTGFSPQNISRYLRDVVPPATFCSALVERMGINGNWMLAGEGAMRQTDVGEPAAHVAGAMVELSRAMSAVARMRLGAISGNLTLERLRRFGEELREHERTKEQFQRKVRPVVDELLDMLRAETEAGRLDRAQQAKNALENLLGWIDGREILDRVDRLFSRYESLRGNAEGMLVHTRQMFLRSLSSGDTQSSDFCRTAFNFAASLTVDGRFHEAWRVCVASRALARGNADTHEGRCALALLAGDVLVRLGDLRRALHMIAAEEPGAQGALSQMYSYISLSANVLAGALPPQAVVVAARNNPEHLARALAFLLWAGDAGAIQALLKTGRGGQSATKAGKLGQAGAAAVGVVADPVTYLGARAWLKARQGVRDVWRAYRDDCLSERTMQTASQGLVARVNIYAADIAIAGGDLNAALTLVLEEQEKIGALPAGVIRGIPLQAVHYRNALRLLPREGGNASERELRAEARAFFEKYIRRGYRAFESALHET